MGGPLGEILNYVADTYDDPTGSIGFTTDTIVYLQAGATYGLSLYAYVTGQTDESLDEFSLPNGKYATFSAKVDPHFTILGDNAASYHFEGLPDSAIRGTPSAVPEPASWLMMICGFGVIGCAMRRSGRAAASVSV
ncbi:PEP-CTERM sorting domain-containing protein [Sphingomonas sp. AP4-R1]|nr:PEP-CTERM sorting domain-containing protein [Sphingomonas sp. AP4-R1]